MSEETGAPVRARRSAGAQGYAPADAWPWVQGKTARTVLTPMQLALAMQALGVTPRALASLFDVPVRRVREWLEQDTLNGRHPMPVGVSEYLRLCVAHRLTAVASGLGVAMVTELDYAPASMTSEERNALDAIRIETSQDELGVMTRTLQGLGLMPEAEVSETVQDVAQAMGKRQATLDRAKQLDVLARRLQLFAKSAPPD